MARSAGVEATRVAGALTSMRIDELISHLAIGIATGQSALDQACMEIATFMGESRIDFGKKPGRDEPEQLSLIELGFTPNFYQFVDSILEVKVAISSQFEHTYEYEVERTKGFEESRQSNYEYEGTKKGKTRTRVNRLGIGKGGISSSNYQALYNLNSSTESSSSYQSKRLNVTTVDAKYASSYNYSVEGSSTIKTKVVPLPPPQVFEERLRAMVKQMKEREEWLKALYETKLFIPPAINEIQTIGGDPVFPGENFGAGNAVLALNDADIPDQLTQVIVTGLRDALAAMVEKYNKLAVDHWAVIDSLADRQVTDNAIADMDISVQTLVNAYDEAGDLLDDVEADALKASITTIKEAAKRFRDKLSEILARLPETPEEEEGAG